MILIVGETSKESLEGNKLIVSTAAETKTSAPAVNGIILEREAQDGCLVLSNCTELDDAPQRKKARSGKSLSGQSSQLYTGRGRCSLQQ